MTATRREWNELYVFFALLGQGSIALGDAEGKASPRVLPIARISRQEHDGKRDYLVEKSDVRVVGEQIDKRFPREDFDTVARLILEALGRERTDEVESPEGVEDFLDALQIYDMEARTDDRTDFYLTFHDAAFPPMGFRIYSRLCAMPPLLMAIKIIGTEDIHIPNTGMSPHIKTIVHNNAMALMPRKYSPIAVNAVLMAEISS